MGLEGRLCKQGASTLVLLEPPTLPIRYTACVIAELNASDEAYRDLLCTARRLVHTEEEARDLVQDVLMLAVERGLQDWPSPLRRGWLKGVVRNRAVFLARSHARRRRREALWESVQDDVTAWRWDPRFLAALPRSLRVVASLVRADLCAAEIRWVLRLTETAFRKRLSSLRSAVRGHTEEPTVAEAQPLDFGAPSFEGRVLEGPPAGVRRAHMLAALRQQRAPALATHDPDGHAILLRMNAHKTR